MISHDVKPMRTFVIERQSLIAKALHTFFDGNPHIHVVGDATTPQVEDFRRTLPDLVVFGLDDATHEVGDALALMRGVCPEIRLCALSSYANPSIMQRAMEAGADGFLLKDSSAGDIDAAFRLLATGASYVDPRVAGTLLRSRYEKRTPTSMIRELTSRECGILRGISLGQTNKEIAVDLGLSEKTIKNYSTRIFCKLKVSARTAAAVFAVKNGLA